jgi:hypothetical protein
MASVQPLPQSASRYHAAQRLEIAAALFEIRRLWRRVKPTDLDGSWRTAAPLITAVLLTAQERVSVPVGGYVSDVLSETGQGRADAPWATPLRAPLVGTAPDGQPLGAWLATTPVTARTMLARGAAPATAHKAAGSWLNLTASTVLSDTARQTEALHTGVRPVSGYVRMLNPPSCSRCAVLAGKWYRKNQGFLRHPGCDCRHIPASEAVGDDLRLDPQLYFDSLPTTAELHERYPGRTLHDLRAEGIVSQESVFTNAGAQVIREGADPLQVVNARRGMTTAQQNLRGWTPQGRLAPVDRYGRQVYETKEGVTERGLASRTRTKRRGERLMPESILQIAENRDDLQRLLRLHGYIR